MINKKIDGGIFAENYTSYLSENEKGVQYLFT